ncbi:MAG: sugar phosphate isomerase/epimerase [Planctomycetales bacterium]|nr:sugar phosphate isomerase/epimerase [Planctomycetales bacterium]
MTQSTTWNRRSFLAAGAALGAVGGWATTAPAIEPFDRTGYKFKLSLAAYSYRNLLQGNSPQMTLFDFVDDCAKFGLAGTELTSYYFPKDVDADYLRSLKRHCFRQGLDVSGTAIGNDFGHPDAASLQREIAKTKQWIDFAEILGAPVIRIFAGHQKSGQSAEVTHQRIVDAINECCEYAGQHGVHLALENHGGPTATPDGLLKIVRDVDSPWFGVNLDSGNFHGEDVYAELQEIAPYALNVQVKVTIHPTGKPKEETDFHRLSQILQAAHYRGYVVLEFEEEGDVRAESERFIRLLRQAFA